MLIQPNKLNEMTETYHRLCQQYGVMGAWPYMERLFSEEQLTEWKNTTYLNNVKLLNE